MELIRAVAQYWNEFLLAGAGFFVIGIVNLGLATFAINKDHSIIGAIFGLFGGLFCIATRFSWIIAMILGITKFVLSIL